MSQRGGAPTDSGRHELPQAPRSHPHKRPVPSYRRGRR